MKSTVIIDAQYYENYNVGPEGFGKVPHWKPKGGHQFKIEIDTDILFYCDEVAEVFAKMVERHNSIAEKFEYIGYEIQFQEPTVLGSEEDFLTIYETINQPVI